MSNKPCKRFWEGAVGISLTPRKQQSGEYFWTFAFVRAFKRKGSEKWEYAQHYSQKHAVALGQVMSKAFQFIEQNEPAQFVQQWESESDAEANVRLDAVQFPSLKATAAA